MADLIVLNGNGETDTPQNPKPEAHTIVHYGHPDRITWPGAEMAPAAFINRDGTPTIIPDRQTLYEPETGRVWTPFLTDGYELIRHETVVNTVMAAAATLPEFGTIDPFVSLPRDGARCKLTLRFPDVQYDIRQGTGQPPDFVNPRIEAFNSYDTGWALKAMFGAFRLVCTNGLVIGRTFAKYRKEHHQGIDIEDIRTLIVEGMEAFSKQVDLWTVWANQKMTGPEIERILNRVKLSEGQLKRLMEMPERADEAPETAPRLVDLLNPRKPNRNVWTVYNLLTQFATHETTSDILRERMMGKIQNAFYAEGYEDLKAA